MSLSAATGIERNDPMHGQDRCRARGDVVMAGRGGGRVPVRAVFAYGAALAMTPYLLIKISWVTGALSGLPSS
ncbi:hypothetical protein Ate01nite_39490 [Actinoplanes teichomyceticus]|nr:hypothetical protein Ate01nite_39490 [Actinoplanes teichomyceticus]